MSRQSDRQHLEDSGWQDKRGEHFRGARMAAVWQPDWANEADDTAPNESAL
jgi:hypothetical protein